MLASLKGRFIGEMDSAECGYIYEGQFVNEITLP